MLFLKNEFHRLRKILWYPLLLLTGLFLLQNACFFSRSSKKLEFNQEYFEKLSLREAYRASLRIMNIKGYRYEGYLKKNGGFISTDWSYFIKAKSNWKFRYRLDLKIFRNEAGYIEVSLSPEYEGGYLIRSEPFSPIPVGYVWNRLEVDEPLRSRIDSIFMDLKKNFYPIKSEVFINSPRQLKYARFKISGLSSDIHNNFPSDGTRQKLVQKNADYIVIDITAKSIDKTNTYLTPMGRESRQKYLLPTKLCPADNENIRSLAHIIKGEESDTVRWVEKIAEWIHKEMTPTEGIGIISAPEIMKSLKGDCTEYTVLMISLCRALGIPARAALGAMYIDGIFDFHMWPEVYIGHWQEIDPMWLSVDPEKGEYFVDATHIKFKNVHLNEGISQEITQTLMPILGEIKLQILDYN